MGKEEYANYDMMPTNSDNSGQNLSVNKKKRLNVKMLSITMSALVILAALGGVSMYFYTKYQHTQDLLHNPSLAAQEEVNTLVNTVGKYLELPAGEVPTVATVSDKSKLADQPFFAKAEKGDKVLIYARAGKIILYRPTLNKIIEVAMIPTTPSVAGTSTASAQLQTATLTIYNGTQTVGLASVVEKKVKSQLINIQTIAKLNSKGDYQKSILVVLTPEAKALGDQLAAFLKADITTMPAEEAKPATDLLFIVGRDFQP
jgi:hypothetical protein